MHRVTLWQFDDGSVLQVSVCCASAAFEPFIETTEQVGPFDDWRETVARLLATNHGTAEGCRAHQLELFDLELPQ